MRRAAMFAAGAIIVVALLVVGLAWLLSSLVGQQVLTAVAPIIAFLLIVLIMVRLIRGIGRAAVPLGELIEASARVEAGEVGTQVAERGPREVRALARSFNSMSSRLAQDVSERRRLLADVSHELRTPLTVIQGSIEGMIDGLYPADRPQLERLLAETQQLERLVEDLRTLSLADAGALPLHREPTDLGALATDVVAGFESHARTEGVTLGTDAPSGPMLNLDPHRVRQVVTNLVSNALRHTPSGGRIDVRLRHEADGAVLEVADTGLGMDAEAVKLAFDRFWRAGDRAGAGLGLAIVRDLVRAHGGEADLESSPGRGTTVRCRFPT